MSRKYCGTLNNYTEDDYNKLLATECKYYIIGKEVGEQGTPHLQMFFYFKSVKTLAAMKKIHNKVHWEVAKGTAAENKTYCSKEGNFIEQGTMPMNDEQKGVLGKRVYEEAWALAKKGDMEGIHPSIRINCYNTLKKIEADYRQTPPTNSVLVNEWRWGPTGTGKSRPVQEGEYGRFYLKTANTKWWDGYTDEETVLIDDFDKDNWKMGYDLKIWADHYPFRAEVKGGSMMIRPKRIIVTSNWKIDEIWSEEQTKGPLKRRFSEIEYK